MSYEDLASHGIVTAMIAVLKILMSELVVDRSLVSIGTFRSACAFSLYEERAYVRSVAFVIGIGSCQLL